MSAVQAVNRCLSSRQPDIEIDVRRQRMSTNIHGVLRMLRSSSCDAHHEPNENSRLLCY